MLSLIDDSLGKLLRDYAAFTRQKQDEFTGTSAHAVAMSRRCLMMAASLCLPSRVRHS
jgi:hypothetical protein